MGHTVWSQRIASDIILDELRSYGASLRATDRAVYDAMLKQAYTHYGSISYTSSFHVWAMILLSVLLEQEKRIRAIERGPPSNPY
ncbi:MAG: hypothetical protein ABIH41_06905 [Nanoarchaeota archaeon]